MLYDARIIVDNHYDSIQYQSLLPISGTTAHCKPLTTLVKLPSRFAVHDKSLMSTELKLLRFVTLDRNLSLNAYCCFINPYKVDSQRRYKHSLEHSLLLLRSNESSLLP